MRQLLLAIGVLLLAWPAAGADWLKLGRATQVTTGLDARSGVSWATNSAASDVNSPMLNVTQCENIDILFFRDLDDGGASTNTVNIYSCAQATDGSGVGPTNAGWNSTGVCWIIQNATLDGDASANTEAIYGAAANWIYVDIATWSGVTPLTIIRCNP